MKVLLYLLLMETRYHQEVDMGLLWYLEQPTEMQTVQMKKTDMDSLIQARNEFASYLKYNVMTLPPMVQNPRKCQYCYRKVDCAAIHKVREFDFYKANGIQLIENGNTETSGMGEMFDTLTDHLNDQHKEFLQQWIGSNDSQEAEMKSKLPFIWHPSEEICKTASVSGIRDLKLHVNHLSGSAFPYLF